MGTWDDGLLDNDTSHDGLGDLHHAIVEDIERLGRQKPGSVATAKLGAAVGVLLQLSSYDFDLETDTGPKIAAAVKAHGKELAKLAPAARKVLEQVAAGGGKALAERPAKMSAKEIGLLSAHAAKPPFGQREPSLFAARAAASYVQEIAKRCVSMVDEDFEDEDNWSDLCREGMGMGGLAVLLVLDPCKVPASKVARWRKCAKKGLASLVENEDEELDFHRGYYANLDGVLARLEKRFAAR